MYYFRCRHLKILTESVISKTTQIPVCLCLKQTIRIIRTLWFSPQYSTCKLMNFLRSINLHLRLWKTRCNSTIVLCIYYFILDKHVAGWSHLPSPPFLIIDFARVAHQAFRILPMLNSFVLIHLQEMQFARTYLHQPTIVVAEMTSIRN